MRAAPVHVHTWEILDASWPDLRVRISCGGGTYIRALARDLGRSMQSAACLSELRREEAGPFRVADADPWAFVREGRIAPRPIREALGGMPVQVVDADDARRVAHGMAVAAAVPADRVALLNAEGELLAVARRENDRWQPEVVLAVA